jgi:UDP-N-acetylmuramoylalanine--D-glutamate ligase
VTSHTSQAPLGDVLVLGLGRTGTSVARYLATLPAGRVRSVTLYGGTSSEPGEASCALEGLGVAVALGTDEVRGRFDLAVASPGIPERSAFFRAAAATSTEVIGEPEFAYRESPARWVAITGTNGKTTTTSLTTHVLLSAGLSAESVGNIGTNVCDRVRERPQDSWFVAELSSFQLATTRLLHPRVAVLLNLTPDHLEWHGTLEAYAAAKERVFANLDARDLAVVSVDDEPCRAVRDRLAQRDLRVCELSVCGAPESACAAFLREGMLVVRLDGVEHVLVAADELQIRGLHNAENALAAAAVALELGVSEEAAAAAVRTFSPIEHRIEPVATVRGVSFINDSKATNTDSVEKALTAFAAGTVVVLLGGHDKGTDLASLARAVCARCRVAVCFGAAGERIAAALEDARDARDEKDPALVVLRAAHLREAFTAAVAAARPHDTVLLSPACSSFDEFSNMAERGRAFKGLVRDLARGGE